MNRNPQRPINNSIISLILLYGMITYSAWAIWTAYRHGMYTWGALGDYSLFVYVLTLGLISSAFVFLQSVNNGLRAAFLLLFLGFSHALDSADAMKTVSREVGWLFEFIGYVAGFAVIAAGIVLEEQRRNNRRVRSES